MSFSLHNASTTSITFTVTTLYARYVEEQTAGLREILRRLSEDVGRLEGIAKAQA